jgi:signal transduction histidine kinase
MSSPPLEPAALLVDIGHESSGAESDDARYPIEMKMASEANSHNGVSTKTPREADAHVAALADVRRLERVFADCEWRERRVFVRARKRARARALQALEGAGSGADATRTALLVAAGELLGAMKVELVASPVDAARLAQQLEEIIGLSRIALAREVLRAPELLTVSPSVALDVQLAMLTALAPLRSASLWTLDDAEQIHCMRHVGEGAPSRGTKELAQRLLAGESIPIGARRLLLGLPVGRWRQPLAALVGCAKPGMHDRCHSFLAEAVPMLGAILERETLLAGNAASERALVESSERKLTRLGFDLHDGPIQDVVVLAQDLRLFKSQLESQPETVLGTPGQGELIRGRMEDLEAQLVALDVDLRRISNEVRAASVLLNRPFTRALRDITQAFAARTNIDPCLALDGELRELSASQQIALLNIIHEALTNVREHSDATEVEIVVSMDADGVKAHVIDNGRGFDLEPTLIRAARERRLGLVAMHERVRLLGGQCRIDSRPGGPTVIAVALERWEPLVREAQPSRVSA